jgi:hypothetical protein
MGGVVWRRLMAGRLKLTDSNTLTVRQIETITTAAASLPPAQRNGYFVYCGRVLQARARGRTITDLDVDRAIRDALAQVAAETRPARKTHGRPSL